MSDKQVKNSADTGLSVQQILTNLWGKRSLILLTAVICALLTLVGSLIMSNPGFEVSVIAYVESKEQTDAEISDVKDLAEGYDLLLKDEASLEKLRIYLDLNLTDLELKQRIVAVPVSSSEWFSFRVTGLDPEETERLAATVGLCVARWSSEPIEKCAVRYSGYEVLPLERASANHLRHMLEGFLFGALFCVGLVLLTQMFDQTVRTAEDIRRICKYPLFTAGDTLKEDCRKTLCEAPDSAGVCNVLGVSQLTGQGETAVQLACALAKNQKQVLLIDCDLYDSALSKQLGISRATGLADYLEQRTALKDLIRICRMEEGISFHAMTFGRSKANGARQLYSDPMIAALDALCPYYDYILLQFPACKRVGDHFFAAPLVDGILVDIPRGFCKRAEFAAVAALYRLAYGHVAGIVLSDEVHGSAPGTAKTGKT